ncbi:MAG: phospho-N-acetylmuramoyl-pentapeptide-transferase [Candidatus Adiutrix sp.]|jgi:phospho-N-acetylmuramoyl-pentapeptide-transferase|nr:phospho-N-acetylmuramoyl-pentapeptide-transferase [Candidatus Adiutrix sp.]
MFYHLFSTLTEEVSFFNVFKYVTFRSILAAFTAMVIWFLLGPGFINLIKNYQIQQYIRDEGPASHKKKSGTPTMGGVLILAAALSASLMWVDLAQPTVWLMIICGGLFAALGFHDDFLKIKRKHNQGLTARQKLAGQFAIGLAVGGYLCLSKDYDTILYLPVFKEINFDLGWFYIPFAALVICGASNAVNLTDGLDGLAAGPVIIASLAYMVFIYCAGHARMAQYLSITYVPGAAEVTVVLAGVVGAAMGFLWFNTYPAQIFMGDVGSLSLGAILGLAALIAKQELILIVVGGLFVMEALSVIIQVAYFKATGGRRVFRMAPLHHHFELKGWPEPKVIVRFWLIAVILAMIGLSTLKVR